MFIRSDTFEMGAAIPARCAYGRIGPEGTVDSDNLNPDLAWGDDTAGAMLPAHCPPCSRVVVSCIGCRPMCLRR